MRIRIYTLAAMMVPSLTACGPPTVVLPPIIAPPQHVKQASDPSDTSACVTWNDAAFCARWISDGQGGQKLELVRR